MLNSLKSTVEQRTIQLRNSNLFLKQAHAGNLSHLELYEYLEGLRYLFDSFQQSMLIAERVSHERNQPVLANFFREKFKEEQGHSAWAENDMRHFEKSGRADTPALREAKKMVQFLHSIIDEEPALYVPFMYTLEYFTVLAGPSMLESLQKKQGIEASKLTAVSNHVKLDEPHVEDDLGAMAAWQQDSDMMHRFEEVIKSTMDHVDRYLAACISTTN